jgi:iron complex outermembrane recepter protein
MRQTVSFLLFAFLAAPPASAQPQSDEIIVTALGRAQALQRTPDSIQAFDASAIAQRGFVSVDDILAATPGVYMINDQDPGTNLISVRGVSTNRNQVPSIAFVVDDLALPEAELFTLRLYDLARVEVLKGPQGALFGRSASGGVMALTTAAPSADFGGSLKAGFASGDSWTADGVLNLPVSPRFQLRSAFSLSDSRGFLYNPTQRRLVDAQTSLNARLRANWLISDTLTAQARFGFAQDRGGAATVSSGDVTGRFNGRLSGAALQNPIGDYPGFAKRRWLGWQGGLERRFRSGARLSLSIGWDSYWKQFEEELDFRPDAPLTVADPAFPYVLPNGAQPIRQPVDVKALTGQVKLTSADDARLRWIAGLFASDVTRDRVDDFEGFDRVFGGQPLLYRTRSTQIGVFGQAAVNLSEQIELTAALRYDADDRRQRISAVSTGVRTALDKAVFDKWQPKVSLAWRPNAEWMAYATAAIGFKAGGFNPDSFTPGAWPRVFKAEETQSLEVGAKASGPGWRAAVAGFATDYKNFQNTVFLGNNVVFSVPQVNVLGLEASGAVTLPAGFALDAGFSWVRSKAGRYVAPNPTPEANEPTPGCGPALCDFTGRRTPNAPDMTLDAGLSWAGVWRDADLTARLGVQHVGSIFYEIDNVLRSPPRTTLEARAGLTLGRFSLEAWGRNLTDERWAISAFGQQQLPFLLYLRPGGPFDSYTINRGREWGLSAGVAF